MLDSIHNLHLDNVVIDDNTSDNIVMTIEGPNSKRTLIFISSFLFFLFLFFLSYLFLTNSKYTKTVAINTGENRKIDVNNINPGSFLLRIYSLKSNTNLNPNKIYFGQFRVNISVNYYFNNHKNYEIIKNNILIEPSFESDEKVSFPITLYDDQIPKNTKSASFIISSERVSINKIVLEFVFDNSIHHFIDSTWNAFGSIIVFFLIFQYYMIFRKNKKIIRMEHKITLIYLISLCLGNLPFSFLFSFYPLLQTFQKSLTNAIFLCSFLIFFKSIKVRGRDYSLFPYFSITSFLFIIDLIDTKFALHYFDAFIGIFYFTVYLVEINGAWNNYDKTEKFKLLIYSFTFTTIQLLLFLSRMITTWCEMFYLKHLNIIFPYLAHITYASIIAYIFYPINPTEEVEYSRLQK
ncbi:hypothetical protein M9Y10_044200 [Tritrichomonas musculus]|uniref:Intimal thickness related receptor IRP domain-containing protein n=1 Tax=Tritrichomonas musculus TaxID=1915356 RepID=A0ABR2K1S6_9EUKA